MTGLRENNPDPALVEQAKKKAPRAESIQTGSGAYDMACFCALEKDYDGCRKRLKVLIRAGALPSCKHISTDRDLDNVRDQVWFQDFMKSGCP
ncbi:conserved hypothetical protein [Desulfatibacillum aliphaticivorans]|uniref:Uncharacterized protein n=1 Tax=Desulfatibacillum aliphaticivorans TaxID=218208 RepID=B8FH83_DESAL|nr:hypothetical protein [Desulfatibacillum aliphaticivorans]ACL02171.1 conserved hypothetical protein [Desulfatibacillum aliphaticivorans]